MAEEVGRTMEQQSSLIFVRAWQGLLTGSGKDLH
jgi:hypothetical protein